MRTPFRGVLFLTAAAVVLFLLFASFLSAQPAGIDPHGLAQIQALLEEKESRTPAQRKIDSNLLYAAKMNQRQSIANGVATLETGIDVSPSGTVVVDIVGTVSDPLLERLEGLGAKLLDARIGSRGVRAEVALADLETIAGWPDVVFVNRKQEATTVGNAATSLGLGVGTLKGVAPGLLPKLKAGFMTRAANVRRSVAAALKARAALKPNATSSINVSEGRVTHRADLVVSTLGVTGAGVKVGVLSDGVSSLASLQASGDLGAVTVLPGQAGSGDEGSAMLEIVHDLAPGAQLYFATAFTSITSFAQNIKDLRTAGCDIIVDDVFYFVETPFQRGQAPSVASTTNGGLVTQAVATVTAAGALYFSSAGNSGNLDDAQSGTWEGDFADGGAVGLPITGTGNLHSFGANAYDVVTAGSGGGPTNLYWSDPLGGSANDYDLFRLNSNGTSILSASTNTQTGTQDPYEQVAAPGGGDRLVIVKRTGAAARFLHLSTNRGRLSVGTAGETHGHSATPAQFAFTVAATPAAAAFGASPPWPTGPYPGVFTGSNQIELFSSDGPRRVFFNADSTAITPGNFSSTGGFTYPKPDFTAADGVSVAAPGFLPFFGTSAAAPHAAAIAALVKSAAPAFTQTQIANALTSTAIDIEAAGNDRQSGSGILDALAAVQSTGVSPRPGLLLGTITATEVGGNANGSIEPGECGVLDIQLTNLSGIAATAVSATLSSPTPGVTIVAGTAPYPDIPGSSSATNITRFKFSLANTVACPLFVDFTLTVSFSGSGSPLTFTFVLRTGVPPVTVNTTLDTTAPPNVAGVYTAVTGTESPRLFRNVVASACGTAKAFPGTTGSGPYRYDAYTFTNCAAGPVCVRVSVTQTSGISGALFTAAYSGSFNPASIATNYLADAGTNFPLNSPASYSFDVAAGATFVVVINELNVGGGIGANYTLNVDGLCLPCQVYTGTGCPTCPTITVAPASLPSGTAGTAYNQVVTPSGGVGPYGFVVTGLPAGMTATPSASSVTLGGTPTASFSGSVTVSGADANGCPFSKVYSLTIACAPPGPIPITTASTVCSLSVGNTASVPDLGAGTTYTWGITNGTITGGQGTRTITYTAGASGPINLSVATSGAACSNTGGNTNVTVDPTCGSLFTLAAPCRLIDTRNANGPTGGPALAANMGRTFPAATLCGIPSDAKAIALVAVAVAASDPGDIRLFPTGAGLPLVSAINFKAFRNRANNAVVPLGASGQFDAFCDMPAGSTGSTHFVVDIYGYIR